mgnify:CR=1 FL=1|jgi:hypothetical protein
MTENEVIEIIKNFQNGIWGKRKQEVMSMQSKL